MRGPAPASKEFSGPNQEGQCALHTRLGENPAGSFFSYRGFTCLIERSVHGFRAVILWDGKPIRVNWGRRDIWHHRASVRKALKGFIKFRLLKLKRPATKSLNR